MAWGRRSEGGGGAGRLALLVAFLALVLAWAAYRRTGGELGTLWDDLARGAGGGPQAAVAPGEADRESWLERAEDRLRRRRTEVAADRDLQRVRREVAEVRAGLERAYRGADAQARARWRGLDAGLERLEGQLEQGGSKALAALDSVLAKIRSEKEDERQP